MTDSNKSWDILWVFKDIWQTWTQELSKNVWSMLSATPSNQAVAQSGKTPSWNGNQISVAQEKREKEVIDRRKG